MRAAAPEGSRGRRALWLVLALAVVIRLPYLTAPIADRQSWNQCSTASVIRNLAERDFNPLRPQWDVLDPGPARDNIEAEEAPIYATISAALYRIFGASHAWPRLLSVAAMLFGSAFLYQLVRRLFDERAALAAVFVWNFAPYPWFFGRTIMSDPWMVACVIAAAERYHAWLESERDRDLWLAGLATCFAALFKVFALYLGVLFLAAGLRRQGLRLFAKPAVWLFGALCLALPLAWILYALRIGSLGNVSDPAGDVFAANKLWSSTELLLSGRFWNRLQSRLFDRSMTPVATAFVAVSLLLRETRSRSRYLWEWFGATLVFALVIGDGHYRHNYYQLPFTPPLAALAGAGATATIERAGRRYPPLRLAVIAALAFLTVSVLYVRNEYRQDPSSTRAGEIAASATAPGDLLLVLDPGDTRKNQVIYHAHRRGWHVRRLKPEDLDTYREWGADAVVLCWSDDQRDRVESVLPILEQHRRRLARSAAWGDGRLHHIAVYSLSEEPEGP